MVIDLTPKQLAEIEEEAEENRWAQEQAELWGRLENEAERARIYFRTREDAERLAVELRTCLRLLDKGDVLNVLAILIKEREP